MESTSNVAVDDNVLVNVIVRHRQGQRRLSAVALQSSGHCEKAMTSGFRNHVGDELGRQNGSSARSRATTQAVSNKADFVGLSPRLLSIGLSP
jgi:hypothetical protein